MRLVSWNVNGIRAAQKKGFLNFMEGAGADFVGVQETKAWPDQLDEAVRDIKGFQSYWSKCARKGYSGTAAFSKAPVAEFSDGIGIEAYDSEGRFCITKINDVTIYNVYFPNGASGKVRHNFKMSFLTDFLAHLKRKIDSGEKLIVMGDYNVAPQDVDVYDPIKLAKTSGFLPEEKDWFQSFLKAGFVDTFRHFHPNRKNVYSWWNQIERARVGNRGWRIDMICVTQNLIPQLKAADIWDKVEGSDHCPVLAEIDI
ncbi:MAG: exodeoxyribonuclease III [Bdellovibrionales bacterium CG10_big_fil_rev_8_21_14_0_10_45_34]|nr:MAG: exodeoxyribonuclease III [Bdellovibrionales bacterium CG10_big_fil_rev_8_21_14_0_10_45_34]